MKLIQKHRVIKNASMSIVQVVFSGLVLFVLYRYLLRTIGVQKLGIWSLVLSTTSLARLTDFGLTGSIVKFVAKYNAREDVDSVNRIIQTAVISMGLCIGVIILIFYPLIKKLMMLILPPPAVVEGNAILPFALGSLWLNVISGVYLSGLDGYQRFDLRNILLMVSATIYLLVVVLIVPKHGLIGLAFAQVFQAGFTLIGGWLLLRQELASLPFFPHSWRHNLFKEMLGYGVNFQIMSVAIAVGDPLVKSLLSRFGGLGTVGYFDMANRLVLQFRSLIVSANQVLVPFIATTHEHEPARIRQYYLESYRLVAYVSFPLYAGIIAASPVISEIWIGHYESVFVHCLILLSSGLCINTLSAPAYFSNLGTGQLRWNAIAHVVIVVVSGVFGISLGLWLHGMGVVIGYILSLIIGSMLLLWSYQSEYKIRMSNVVPRDHYRLFGASIAGAVLCLAAYALLHKRVNIYACGGLIFIMFPAIVFLPLWSNPTRLRLTNWFSERYV